MAAPISALRFGRGRPGQERRSGFAHAIHIRMGAINIDPDQLVPDMLFFLPRCTHGKLF
jgi:hypothetical protein